jgi:cell division septation protein DedD
MDQYITAEDRQRGTALAQQIAAQQKLAQASAPATSRAQQAPAPTVRTPVPSSTPAQPPRVAASTTPARTAAPARKAEKPAPKPEAPAKPAPKAAPKPVPAKPAPATARASGKWRIQLGAFRDRANAETLWSRVRGKLGGAQPSYVAAGPVTRLQAGGFATRADATRACAASGQPCVVVNP